MKKTFTVKFKQQAELLRASLEAMPVHDGPRYLLNHKLGVKRFIEYILVTRYPELSLAADVSFAPGYDIGSIEILLPSYSGDIRTYDIAIGAAGSYITCLSAGPHGERRVYTKNMKFMEAFYATVDYIIAQMRKTTRPVDLEYMRACLELCSTPVVKP